MPIKVLLNTWLHIYKKQRREQELVSNFFYFGFMFQYCKLTPCINPDWTWSDRGGHIRLRIRHFVWVIYFYLFHLSLCLQPYLLKDFIYYLNSGLMFTTLVPISIDWEDLLGSIHLGWNKQMLLQPFFLLVYSYAVTQYGRMTHNSQLISCIGFHQWSLRWDLWCLKWAFRRLLCQLPFLVVWPAVLWDLFTRYV